MVKRYDWSVIKDIYCPRPELAIHFSATNYLAAEFPSSTAKRPIRLTLHIDIDSSMSANIITARARVRVSKSSTIPIHASLGILISFDSFSFACY